MPAEFYSGWTVESPTIRPVVVPMASQYCRDIAYHAMTRDLYTRFTIEGIRSADVELFCYGWHKWVERNAPTLVFSTQIAHSIGASHREWFRDYSIPLVISKLRRKFPDVTFTPYEYTDQFSGVVFYGMELHGSVDIVPAFYWAVYIMRCVAAEGPGGFRSESGKLYDWKDVNTLILRACGGNVLYSHYVAWNSLREGTAATGLQLLQWRTGPLGGQVNQGQIDFYARNMRAMEQQTLDPTHNRHGWFHDV